MTQRGERLAEILSDRRTTFVVTGLLSALMLALFYGLLRDDRDPELLAAPAPAADTHRSPARSAPGLGREDAAGRPVSEIRTDADARLGQSVEAAIMRAALEARRRTDGRVGPDDVVVAVYVIDLASGRERLARLADAALRPASNMKLLTTAAALVLLGPDARFETTFEIAGDDLVARAGGDPLYMEGGDGSVDPWLDVLAQQLRAAGAVRFAGQLLLDEGTFADPAPGPGWPGSSEYWKEYCALAGGFSANAGCLTANVRPGAVGAKARVAVRPRHHGLTPRGSVKTVGRGGKLTVAVGATSETVTVRGKIPASVSLYEPRFAHPDPVRLFGHAISRGLAQRGIEIRGGFRRQRGVPAGTPVARLTSPIAGTLVPILTHSNNSVADQLFLTLGHRVEGAGTRDGGSRAIARALALLGVSTAGLVQRDGSGLSRENRVSARQLGSLIAAVMTGDRSTAEAFHAALAGGGEPGSLRRRMKAPDLATRVRGKTGFINGTSSLSGVIETRAGATCVFSILVNYPTEGGLNTHCWKPMQDEICLSIFESDP